MKVLKYVLLLGGLFLVSRLVAQPVAPQNLTANSMKFQFEGYTKIVVGLKWDKVKDANGADIPLYNIYRKDGDVSSTNDFQKLGQVLWRNSYQDPNVVVGETYTYYVTAQKNGESQSSNMAEVTVTDNPLEGGTASISGMVTDEVTEIALEGIYVSAISVSALTVNTVTTDVNGSYTLELLPGEYLIYFRASQDYWPEFYDNVRHAWEASSFVLADNDSYSNIDAALTPMGLSSEMFNISGNVSDNSGNPVDAIVDVMSFGYRNFPRKHVRTRTDSDGNYSVAVKGGSEVVLFAQPMNKNLYGEFYENSYSLANATRIMVNDNISDINFVLEPRAEGNSSISGIVANANNEKVDAMIVAIKLGVDRFNRDSNLRTFADENGYYEFNNLTRGDYILFAVPEEGYLPTFYKEDGTPTFRWRDADVLTVDDNTNLTGINFIFSEMPGIPENGFAEISGTVMDDNGQPVVNAYVYILDENNNTVTYSFTDQQGNYNAQGLTPGVYSVACDNYALSSEETDNVYAGLNEQTTVNFTLTPDTPVSVEETPIVTAYELEQNYPNPFNPSTVINFSILEKGNVKLTVYNILGSKIRTLINKELNSGSYKIQFDASDLPTGMYIYELSTNKFTQSRKMLLIK